MLLNLTRTLTCGGVEVEVIFDFYPGTPARISGPPEDCDPGDPDEVEIHNVKILSGHEDDERSAQEFHDDLSDALIELMYRERDERINSYYEEE